MPDGLTVFFYQKIWDIVKEDLTGMINKFMFDGVIVQCLNDINICLIPKKKTNQTKCLNFGLLASVMWVIRAEYPLFIAELLFWL